MTADLGAIRARLAAGEPRLVALIQGGRRWGLNSMRSLIAHAPADLAALCDEVESLRAAVERVRALHVLRDARSGIFWAGYDGCACDKCGFDYPCPTLRALDGAE